MHKFMPGWTFKIEFSVLARQKDKAKQPSTCASASSSAVTLPAATSPPSVPAQPSWLSQDRWGPRSRAEVTGFVLQWYMKPVTTLGCHTKQTQRNALLEMLPYRYLQTAGGTTNSPALGQKLQTFSSYTLPVSLDCTNQSTGKKSWTIYHLLNYIPPHAQKLISLQHFPHTKGTENTREHQQH